MQVIAALGDAPTAAIAVVAILLGLLFAARGPRDKRGVDAGDAEERAPMMVASLPVAAAPDTEPGFVGPEGTVVGHGPIRLGVSGPLGGGDSTVPQPAAAPPEPEPAPPPPPPEPEPAPEPALAPALAPAEPEPQPEPGADPALPPTPAFDWGAPAPPALTEPAASETAFFASPPTIPEPLAGAVALPDATPPQESPPATAGPAPAEEAPAGHPDPAWRVAARAANSAVHFRQGTIKLGGKRVDKDKDKDKDQ